MVHELATIAEDASPADVEHLERLLDDAEAACR
jgi:hypothetical protein